MEQLIDSVVVAQLPTKALISSILVLSILAVAQKQLIGLSFLVSFIGARITTVTDDYIYLLIGFVIAFLISRLTLNVVSKVIGLLYIPRLLFVIIAVYYLQGKEYVAMVSEAVLLVQLLLLLILIIHGKRPADNAIDSGLNHRHIHH